MTTRVLRTRDELVCVLVDNELDWVFCFFLWLNFCFNDGVSGTLAGRCGWRLSCLWIRVWFINWIWSWGLSFLSFWLSSSFFRYLFWNNLERLTCQFFSILLLNRRVRLGQLSSYLMMILWVPLTMVRSKFGTLMKYLKKTYCNVFKLS